MRSFLFALLICASSLSAAVNKRIVHALKGIVIYNSWEQVRLEPVDDIDAVVVDSPSLLSNHPEFSRKLFDQYVGNPLTENDLIEIKEKIARFYQSHNQPYVLISIPRQKMKKAILQLVVEEVKLGKVITTGNCHFPSKWISDAIRTCAGEAINAEHIYEDIAWLNLNPFRRTDAIYRPGAQIGTADLELITIDRWPYRFYMGGDNTGTEATNRNRLFFGFNFGKSVLKDGQISYQFTCAPNWNLFYAHTASARLPLPWRHIWDLWGGYTQATPYKEANRHQNEGISWQVDTRYRIPFFKSQKVMQTVVVGYDFKETNNTLEYDEVDIVKASADINQFMVGYELGYRTKHSRATLIAEIYGNPGGITHGDQTKFYDQLRYGAKSHYIYGKLAQSFARETEYGAIHYDLTGQLSSANLLPSEQMTMTGYNAVRGFEERVLNLDSAVILNFAIETPRFSPARMLGYCKEWDELYFLAFFDCGYGGNHHPSSSESHSASLGSIGPGIRYQFDRYFTARFDYGYQLWHNGFHNPSHSRYNFGMILSY
jgi:hemolysin activation/secretion protein